MTKPLPDSPRKLPGRDGYAGFDYTPRPGAATHPVYWRGPDGRPGILLMHELPGLTKETVAFADRLIAARYRVFLPLLFGEPMADSTSIDSIVNYERLCVAEEFGRLAAGVTAPVTAWLRSLATDISAWCNDGPVGAVGMCLTGGFVIPLMLEPTVGAVVTSQPAIPIPRVPTKTPIFPSENLRRAIGVSEADLTSAAVAAKARDLTLVGFRFSSDWKCPRERFTKLKEVFHERFEDNTFETPDEGHNLGNGAHSVLTFEYPEKAHATETHPSIVANERVLAFFAKTLERTPPTQPGSGAAAAMTRDDELSPEKDAGGGARLETEEEP